MKVWSLPEHVKYYGTYVHEKARLSAQIQTFFFNVTHFKNLATVKTTFILVDNLNSTSYLPLDKFV